MEKYKLTDNLKFITEDDIVGYRPGKLNKVIYNMSATDEVNYKTLNEFLNNVRKKNVSEEKINKLINIAKNKELTVVVDIIKNLLYNR